TAYSSSWHVVSQMRLIPEKELLGGGPCSTSRCCRHRFAARQSGYPSGGLGLRTPQFLRLTFGSYAFLPGRWTQPGQQQGRRIPPISLSIPTSMRRLRVSACLADSTQQIHSLRESGVSPSQTSRAFGAALKASCRSAGISCTTPPASFL